MPRTPAHIPETGRNLPADLYDLFDSRTTPDGGRQYSLPHTLASTVVAMTTKPRMLIAVAAAGVACALVLPAGEPGSPLSSFSFTAMLIASLAHALGALVMSIAALVTGTRKVTRITIRSDGLILNDATFYATEHVWAIHYGETSNAGKADEAFHPKIRIQVGTQTITLAEGLQADSAKLFMQLFEQDTRRYWHRHN